MKKKPHKPAKSYASRKRREAVSNGVKKLKLKKGDHVIVMSGKDKGKTGAIAHVFPKTNRIIVEGVAIAKRHTRAAAGQSSRIIEVSRSIDLSNVMLADPKDKKPTRVKRELQNGKMVRVTKKSGTVLA